LVLFYSGYYFAFSCNKFEPDPLEDDLSYLVGTWDWDSTFHRFNWCTGGSTIEETIYPEENNFSIIFEEEDTNSRHVVISLNGNKEDVRGGVGTLNATFFNSLQRII